LFLAGFGRLLLGLEFVLAVIQDFADRRGCVRRNLDEVESSLGGLLEGLLDGDRAKIGSGLINQLNLAVADLIVDARTVLLNGRRGFHRTANGKSPLLLR